MKTGKHQPNREIESLVSISGRELMREADGLWKLSAGSLSNRSTSAVRVMTLRRGGCRVSRQLAAGTSP
jgi:hypothetical protein